MHLDIHLLLCDFCSLCYEGTVPSHQINIYLYFPSRFRQFHLSTSIFHPSDIYCGGGCCSVAKSCPTLCNPMDCSQPGSSDHGILRARILEWVAMPSSQGSPPPTPPGIRPICPVSPHWQADSLPLRHVDWGGFNLVTPM